MPSIAPRAPVVERLVAAWSSIAACTVRAWSSSAAWCLGLVLVRDVDRRLLDRLISFFLFPDQLTLLLGFRRTFRLTAEPTHMKKEKKGDFLIGLEARMSGQGKQAKVLTDRQVRAALNEVAGRRYPERDRVMILLSVKAGLRAKEIALVTWGMVMDAEGAVGDALVLVNGASKGKRGGRIIPLGDELRGALVALQVTRPGVEADDRIVHSERDLGLSPGAVQVWFHRLYASLGFTGASSHSGRRTFVTKAAKSAVAAGGSLRDVQELAGHASLATTQRYIQGDTEAKRRLVNMV